jgi:hypothetical protein
MNHLQHSMRALILACSAALLLAACARGPAAAWSPAAAHTHSRDERERLLQQAWIGRSRTELVASLGPPSLVMAVPGERWPETIVLVYRNRDAAGGCIDAFVVLKESAEIANYFCR